MITVNAEDFRGKKAPLYHRYPQQTSPQPAYIEMTESGTVTADYSGEIGNSVPIEVYHGRTLTWSVPSDVSGDALVDFLGRDDVLSLLNRIHNGHAVEWDGNNMVGRLTDDAQSANETLDELARNELNDVSERTVVCEVGDWLFTCCSLREHWSEVPLSEVVKILESSADDDGIYLDGDLEEALIEEAKSLFTESPEKLELVHVQALLDAGEIDGSEFESWKEEQISLFQMPGVLKDCRVYC